MTTRAVLVAGATGVQGGSVARHLLYRDVAVRALTRTPKSTAARALQAAGATVVYGDLDDAASLRAAVRGCRGVFGMTNYWEHLDAEREYAQGRNLADAAAEAGVEHLVFSTLHDVDTISQGTLSVPHCQGKAQLEAYIRTLDVPATFVHVAFYYDNFLTFFSLQKQEDGAWAFGFPQGEVSLTGVAVEDVGGVVAAIFEDPASFIGRVVGVVGDDLPPAAYAAQMADVLGRPVVFNDVSPEVYASLGFPGAEDLAQMFTFNRRYILNRRADLDESRRLYPSMQSFRTWLLTNQDRFHAMMRSAESDVPVN